MNNFLSLKILFVIFAVDTFFNFFKVFTRLVTIFVAIETKAKSMKTKLNRRPMGQNGHVRNYGIKISNFLQSGNIQQRLALLFGMPR